MLSTLRYRRRHYHENQAYFSFLVSNLYWMNTFGIMYNSEICRNWSSCRSILTCSYPGDLRICSQRWAIGLDMILKLGKTSFCVSSNCRHTSAREWCSLIITSLIYILNPFNKCLSHSLIVRGIEQMVLSLEDVCRPHIQQTIHSLQRLRKLYTHCPLIRHWSM